MHQSYSILYKQNYQKPKQIAIHITPHPPKSIPRKQQYKRIPPSPILQKGYRPTKVHPIPYHWGYKIIHFKQFNHTPKGVKALQTDQNISTKIQIFQPYQIPQKYQQTKFPTPYPLYLSDIIVTLLPLLH